jgi:hypothetical protein
MWFLQQRANKTGQSWWGQDKMAKELEVHVRTIGRWVRELKAENLLDSIRRGSTSNLYTLRKFPVQMTLDVRSDRTKCPNVSIELNLEQGNLQHHRRDDAAASPEEAELKRLAGIPGNRVTAGDRAFLAGLDAPPEVIRAGILLGMARKAVQRANTGVRDPIRSLRYFEGTIQEAKAGLPAGYVQHLEQFVRRHKTA